MEKENKYKNLLKAIQSVVELDGPWVSGFSNTCALVKEHFSWHWVGFYFVDYANERLYLGPFQGPLACTKIPFSKGVCGKAYRTKKTQIITNVHDVKDHIACSSETNSEIVVPLFDQDKNVKAVLDIDSTTSGSFDEVDQFYLEQVCHHLSCIDDFLS